MKGRKQRNRAMFGFEGTNLHKKKVILDSSMVEQSAVNRVVVGSSPTRGVCFIYKPQERQIWLHGQAVKTSPFHGGNTSSNLVGVI